MSTITRELAKLFRKITNSEIDAEGNAHVVLSPADSLLINNARIALASLEAEPYGYVHKAAYEKTGSCGLSNDREAYRYSSTHVAVYTAPPAPVIQADVAQAIENLKQKLVECNRYNYCADAVKGVEDASCVLALQNQNMSAPIRPEAIENAIEYIRSIAFHIDEDDYHGKHIAYFMRQALAWLEGHSCSAESQGKSDNSPLPRYQVIELTVLVKQLVSQLKKAKPDCKLPDRAMDYLLRNGLVSAEGVLR